MDVAQYLSNVRRYADGGLVKQAKNIASKGRFGDTEILHVNKAELAGLKSLMPLTKNPETGQHEAFLPFLLPLLGGIGGSFLGPALGMSAALGSALGTGLMTTAQTGDLGQGVMAGLGGYAMGAGIGALGGAGSAAGAAGNPSALAAQTAGSAASAGVPGAAKTLGSIGFGTPGSTDVFTQAASQGIGGAAPATSGAGAGGGIGGFLGGLTAGDAMKYGLPAIMGLSALIPPSGSSGGGEGSSGSVRRRPNYPSTNRFPRTASFGPVDPFGRERRYFADGGPVQPTAMPGEQAPQQQRVVMEAVLAIQGKSRDPKKAIRNFLQLFGPQAFEMLVQKIKAGAQVPGQGAGRMVTGPGGPTDDAIPAVIDGTQPAALSSGEFVVPAQAVAAAGDGDPEAGAMALGDMVTKLRSARGVPLQ